MWLEIIKTAIPQLITVAGTIITALLVYKAQISKTAAQVETNRKEIEELKERAYPCELVETMRNRLHDGDVRFKGLDKDISYIKEMLEKIDRKV